MAILLSIHPDNPQENRLQQVVDCIKKGGVVIYPTDTVYGIGCNLYNEKAIERICRIKEVKPNKMHLSFICYDLSDISKYARIITTPTFRLMKKALPGAFTFILESNKEVPKLFDMKKKQVGIRVPNHKIPREIVRMLGNPILTTSIKDSDAEHMTDPELIFEMYEKQVDIVIDGGIGGLLPSTVIDCTDDNFEIIRQGAGNLEEVMA
ncbi:MAG: threonylcarbamoyl-AMP synthase [Bacteroidetes bacterium]|nr:MAG: threonylcarbamoyl-AMP synthase [Bacteroidota bacterium]